MANHLVSPSGPRRRSTAGVTCIEPRKPDDWRLLINRRRVEEDYFNYLQGLGREKVRPLAISIGQQNLPNPNAPQT